LSQQFTLQVCDTAKRHVWCCRDGEQATNSELKQLDEKEIFPSDIPVIRKENNIETKENKEESSGKNEALYSDQDSGLWRPKGDFNHEECGLRIIYRNYGGKIADFGNYPYMALLGYRMSDQKEGESKIVYKCGGSLINRWYVLTAAHCLKNSAGEDLKPSQIVLGEYKIGTNPDCERKIRGTNRGGGSCFKKITRSASKVIVHENYDSNSTLATNNIALIRLKKPVPLFDDAKGTSSYDNPKPGTKPVCLPWPSTINETQITLKTIENLDNGEKVTLTGWGYTLKRNNDKQMNKKLKNKTEKGTLQYLRTKTANNLCKANYSKDMNTEKIICTSDDEDICNGDSGGPLVYRSHTDSAWYQVGLVSHGPESCDEGVPRIYTRISAYMDWIGRNMEP